jgi:SAM-dependent methyltransferase
MMSDQAHFWSEAAAGYEGKFIDPYAEADNPLLRALEAVASGKKTAADLGCGIGPLLPELAARFAHVFAVDFAPGMLKRARTRCQGLDNVEFLQRDLTDLGPLAGRVDVAVAVNSLVQPRLADLEKVLEQARLSLRPGGHFLGIVPAIDGVHYQTMILLDRARRTGMPEDQARKNAAAHAEHGLYDFALGTFRYDGLEQHFWQAFEVPYRLGRAGFRKVRTAKAPVPWDQVTRLADVDEPPPWDWFFHARS